MNPIPLTTPLDPVVDSSTPLKPVTDVFGEMTLSQSPRSGGTPTPRASRTGLPPRRPSDMASPSPTNKAQPSPMARRVSHDPAMRVVPRRSIAAPLVSGPSSPLYGPGGRSASFAGQGSSPSSAMGSPSRRPTLPRAGSSRTSDSSRPTSPFSVSGSTTPPRVRPKNSAGASGGSGRANGEPSSKSRLGSSRTSFHMSDSSIDELTEAGSAAGGTASVGHRRSGAQGSKSSGRRPPVSPRQSLHLDRRSSTGSPDPTVPSSQSRRVRRISSGGLEGPGSRRLSKDYLEKEGGRAADHETLTENSHSPASPLSPKSPFLSPPGERPPIKPRTSSRVGSPTKESIPLPATSPSQPAPPARPPISSRRRLSRAADDTPHGLGLGPSLGPPVAFPNFLRRESDSDFMPAALPTEGMGLGLGRRRASYKTAMDEGHEPEQCPDTPAKGSSPRKGLTIDTSPRPALPSGVRAAFERRVVSERPDPSSPASATHHRTRTLSASTRTSYHTSLSNTSSPASAAPSPPVPPRNPLRKASRPALYPSRSEYASTDDIGIIPDLPSAEDRFSRLSQASIPSIPSLPTPSAPTFSLEGSLLVDNAGDSPADPAYLDIPGQRASGDFNWGRKRQGRILDPKDFDLTGISPEMQSSMSALTRRQHKEVDLATAPTSPMLKSAETVSSGATAGHTPLSALPKTPVKDRLDRAPSKSPSMPMLGHGSPTTLKRPSAGDLQTPLRSGTDPGKLLPPLMVRSPTASSLSKRAHLIREIATSERAYANDLALIRDAYIGRRPTSMHSSEAMPSPIHSSDPASARSSVYTSGRRTSQASHASQSALNLPNVTPPLPKSPSVDGSYFTRHSPARMAPPVGKPLAPADVRAVFLNIDQLAIAADELAAEFEQAVPDVDEGEAGSDRLGYVFSTAIPRLRTLFTTYCSRQSAASSRLVELQADPAHAAYLASRWDSIRSQTHAWNLDSMLIKPVQRITKYPLLFDDLLSQTTPVHPDYFAIRSAAEQAKAVASEIDEMKRRKDLVAGVISGSRERLVPREASGQKTPKRGLKLFKREKEGSTTSLSTTLDIPPISRASLAEFKDLHRQFTDAEQVTRRTGKQVVLWTAGVREFWLAQDGLAKTWGYVVRLEDKDPVDKRLVAFRRVVSEIGTGVWHQLNVDVQAIMPVFSRMLDAFSNPHKVILRRNAKEADYTRFHATKRSERVLLDSVRDFTALHSQLVEELPIFLEGFGRMLDMTLVAFARAQARYHAAVRRALRGFEEQWLPAIDGGIVKTWHDAWQPYDDAMGQFGRGMPGSRVKSTIKSSLRPIPARRASADRISFGLPKLSPAEERIFDGLGFTPSSRPASMLSRGPSFRSAASALGSSHQDHSDVEVPVEAQVPLPRLAMPPTIMATGADLDLASPAMKTPTGVPQVQYEPPTPPVHGQERLQTPISSNGSVRSKRSDDAGEGWRGEKVLYQCVAVADFAQECTRRYRKLRFLPVNTGEVIDVYYEVGRIDELPSFPYPEIGVENDGILVGKTPNGDIGLVICSFLEPMSTE